MKNLKKTLVFLPLVAVLLGGCTTKKSGGGGSSSSSKGYIDGREIYTNGKVKGTNYVFEIPEGDYYNSIGNETGDSLLSKLRSLNTSKKTTTYEYSQTKYLSCYTDNGGDDGYFYTFYDGKKVANSDIDKKDGSEYMYNREHVWPKSHGGNLVENDILMVRPAYGSNNETRGNSFYTEGGTGGNKGWDPASFGVESYRGDAARIILYCIVANANLSLLEADYHETSNANPDNLMGRLSTLIKWNKQYPVHNREKFRNSGAQFKQGNRNPFVDHPEYGCKIWGNYNEATKAICK